MSQPQPLDSFLNTVLGDPTLTEDLSDEDKTAMRTAFGNLFKGIEQQVATAMTKSANKSVAVELNEYSDTDLINHLTQQVDAAVCAIELLSNRPIGKKHLDLMRRLELQLTAITLSVSDLQPQPRQRTPCAEVEQSQVQPGTGGISSKSCLRNSISSTTGYGDSDDQTSFLFLCYTPPAAIWSQAWSSDLGSLSRASGEAILSALHPSL